MKPKTALMVALVILIPISGYISWTIKSDLAEYEMSKLQSELSNIEQAIKPMTLDELEESMKPISLEDRFANLMEALSDNHIMRYDVDIDAHLFSDNTPDYISITLHLKAGEFIK